MQKRSRKGSAEYPAAPLAFHGPNDRIATQAVAGIIEREGGGVEDWPRWVANAGDVRKDPVIGEELQRFLKEHHVRSVVATDGILGCPHEAGKDYPAGSQCPVCPFWANRNRFTGELET